MIYNVSGYMTLHYHFCDVEVKADFEEDIIECYGLKELGRNR